MVVAYNKSNGERVELPNVKRVNHFAPVNGHEDKMIAIVQYNCGKVENIIFPIETLDIRIC